jgi:CheY-like chemotaxis protein
VLVVDDEPLVRDVAEQILRHLGYAVVLAASGEEALRLFALRRADIDVVLLDLVLPGIDGREVLRQLRLADRSVPVLMTSGFGLETLAEELRSAGLTGVVRKPYEIEQLAACLARAFEAEELSRHELVPRPRQGGAPHPGATRTSDP